MDNISIEEKEYAERIALLRSKGDIDQALALCGEANEKFQENNFFYKIKGDLLFIQKEYSQAMNSYLKFLECIKELPGLFTNFSRFFAKLVKETNVNEFTFERMLSISRSEEFASVIRQGLLKIICDYWPISNRGKMLINDVNKNYSRDSVSCAFEILKKSEKKCELVYFLSKLDVDNCTKENISLNKQIIKVMEEVQMYDYALKWVLHMLTYSKDGVIVRSLFRICRLRNDYSDAINFMNTNDIAKLNDFNVQYELVLFYNTQGDEENRNLTLKKMDEKYPDSIPIAKTLFNFYVKFDMIGNARAIEQRINKLKKTKGKKAKKKITKTVRENQNLVWKRLNDLIEEQEHNKQLLAMTELIKGFSHELGQPITNIRYAIQLYYMKNEKEHFNIERRQKELLDGILLQTGRVGKLLGRFAPIVSSKNVKNLFVVYDEIVSIFDEMSIRLNMEGITYNISGSKESKLYGESIQFSQIFYNLIINSIYAIKKKGVEGVINVSIKEVDSIVTIEFCDNGIGIPSEIQRKIFAPFFSTKRKEVEEGGEGLGLYIVWNILKMFNGKIFVNSEYSEGAMFVIKINKEERE